MLALGCRSAVNMDGGGSSTAWVNGNGVVNHPTDNGLFDHQGERGVATVFTIKSN
jgi:exopolysaccharide biosynthesis protein